MASPASGGTAERWRRIAALAQADLAVIKLVEPHHDAAAILADLGGAEIQPDDIWAVWAARPALRGSRGATSSADDGRCQGARRSALARAS
ncbi:hypothetical protein [Aeromicrobium sp. UC242_57]|uniref:hypothetical protein n=1 Tax=Aeromicrobium sp. UC242_57 TaxID=3374624 RepID=UPI0037985B46